MDQNRAWHQTLVRFLEKGAWWILLVFLALTALAFKPATRLLGTISTTLSTLLPDDYPTVKVSNEIKNNFRKKGGGDLIIVFESPNASTNRQMLYALSEYLKKHPEVKGTQIQKQSFDFFERHKLLFLELKDLQQIRDRIQKKIQREKLGSLYIDFEEDSKKEKDPFSFDDISDKYRDAYSQGAKNPHFTNDQETVFALWIYPKSDDTSLKFFAHFFHEMSDYVAKFPWDPQAKYAYAGSIKTRIDEYENLTNDLKVAGLISVIGIFLVLMLYFKRIIGVFLIFMPLVSGILIGFSLCSFFIDSLNVVTSFLFSILFGLGVDIGIHMFSRYIHEREAGVSVHDSVYAILFKTGRSSATAVLTTAASFFVLIINDFRGFSEFGWIAGIGLLVTLFCYLVLFPAVLICAERIKLLRLKRHRHEERARFLERFPRVPYPRVIIGVCAVLAAISLVLAPRLSFEWNYGILKMQIPQTQWARQKLREVSGRVNSAAAILINGKEEADLLDAEFQRRKEADTQTPTIDKFISFYELNPPDQKEKMDVLKQIDVLLSDDALNALNDKDEQLVKDFREAIGKTEWIDPEDIPQDLADSFFGVGANRHRQLGFIYANPMFELDDGRNAMNFYDDVQTVTVGGKTFHAASDALVFADVLKTLFRDSEIAISLSFLILMAMVYFDFKNIRKTLLVMGVLVFGMVGMFGAVVLFGWKFNFYNMITIPIVIGMGEDNSVHLMHRFEEFKGKSVVKALMISGGPAFMSGLTTMIGYAGLIFAHHPGLKSIGQVAVAGILTCMLASLVLLAAILQLMADKSQTKTV